MQHRGDYCAVSALPQTTNTPVVHCDEKASSTDTQPDRSRVIHRRHDEVPQAILL